MIDTQARQRNEQRCQELNRQLRLERDTHQIVHDSNKIHRRHACHHHHKLNKIGTILGICRELVVQKEGTCQRQAHADNKYREK